MEIIYTEYDRYEGDVIYVEHPSTNELMRAYAKLRIGIKGKKNTEENIEEEIEVIEQELDKYDCDLEDYDDFKDHLEYVKEFLEHSRS